MKHLPKVIVSSSVCNRHQFGIFPCQGLIELVIKFLMDVNPSLRLVNHNSIMVVLMGVTPAH